MARGTVVLLLLLLYCVVLTVTVSVVSGGEPVVNAGHGHGGKNAAHDNHDNHHHHHDHDHERDSASYQRRSVISKLEGGIMQLAGHVGQEDARLREQFQREDALLKDTLKREDEHLKELLGQAETKIKTGDAFLKDLLLQGEAQQKEQTEREDTRLSEELKKGDAALAQGLEDDRAWTKLQLDKARGRVDEKLEDVEEETTRAVREWKEAFQTLRGTTAAALERCSAVTEQMAAVQAELNRTNDHQNSIVTDLQSTKDGLVTDLQSTKDRQEGIIRHLQSTKDQLQTELNNTKEQLMNTVTELEKTKVQLQSTATQQGNAQVEMRRELNHTRQQMQITRDLMEARDAEPNTGSTFTRWGSKNCPDTASLVYSGVAAGTYFTTEGGGSTYVCLISQPQLGNSTSGKHNLVRSVEYESVSAGNYQDAVCSVCRAPQATTIMIPATLTCPTGWTTQYQGTLVSAADDNKGRLDYVCLDDAREYRDGGSSDTASARFYAVVIACDSLSCPPYAGNKLVTCVVCSL